MDAAARVACAAFRSVVFSVGGLILNSTPPTYHSSDRVAKIGPDSEQVQVPPVAIVAIFVLADLSSANPAQRLPPPWYYIHHHSGFVRLEVETSDPQALQSDELVD